MRWRIPCIAVLALFVAFGCDQQPVGPAVDQVTQTPVFDFDKGPAEPGNSNVIRGEWGGFVLVLTDPVTELRAVIVMDTDFACFDFDEATTVPWQVILNPSGEGLEMYFEGGWMNVAILEPPYECANVVATGQVHNQAHDNAGWMWDGDENRANSYGYKLNGHVGDYNLKWSLRCLWGGLTKPDFEGHCREGLSIR